MRSQPAAPSEKPAPFLSKTYMIVDDDQTNHIVSWGKEELPTFVVWNPDALAREILPRYFKHGKFSSFVRQLHTYGFRKLAGDKLEFGHGLFRKGGQALLRHIRRRRAVASPSTSTASSACPDQIVRVTPINARMPEHAILEENRILRKRITCLEAEISRLSQMHSHIVEFMQNNVPHAAATRVGESSAVDVQEIRVARQPIRLFGIDIIAAPMPRRSEDTSPTSTTESQYKRHLKFASNIV
ncbi:hypothetical protein ACP70R_020153 [Stipagrostis hirtigluma subsp. patula]